MYLLFTTESLALTSTGIYVFNNYSRERMHAGGEGVFMSYMNFNTHQKHNNCKIICLEEIN